MEKSQDITKSEGVCEKIYKAVAANSAFRKLHLVSHRSPSPASSTPNLDTPSKAHVTLNKQVATHKAGPADVNIPIKFGPTPIMPNEKEKIAKCPISVKENDRVTLRSPKIQPSGHSGEDKTKPVPPHSSKTRSAIIDVHIHVDEGAPKNELLLAEVQKFKTSIVASNNGHLDKVASEKEAKPSVVPKVEKPNESNHHGHLNKVTSKKEAKPPLVPKVEKSNEKAETLAPSNLIEIETHVQGVNGRPKLEPAKSHLPVQEEQPKPKTKDQPASVVKNMSRKDKSTQDKVEEGKKPAFSEGSDKFSDYIIRVKNDMMTTKSNAGEQTTHEKPVTRSATRRDSFNDRVANFIHRTKKNIGTTSNVGDG